MPEIIELPVKNGQFELPVFAGPATSCNKLASALSMYHGRWDLAEDSILQGDQVIDGMNNRHKCHALPEFVHAS